MTIDLEKSEYSDSSKPYRVVWDTNKGQKVYYVNSELEAMNLSELLEYESFEDSTILQTYCQVERRQYWGGGYDWVSIEDDWEDEEDED